MDEMGLGNTIYFLRKKIQEAQLEMDALGEPVANMPELISSANLLRSNEYLLKLNEKKDDLILTYAQYSESLENMLSEIFEIQNDLKNILKEQSSLIANDKSYNKKQSKTKDKRKSIKK